MHNQCPHTKSNYIKHFNCLVHANTRKTPSISTNTHPPNLPHMCPKLLHKLDSHRLFFPELDYPVNGGRDEKVCVRRDGNKGNCVPVHEGFGVFSPLGEGSEVELLVSEGAAFFPGCLGGEGGANVSVGGL